MGIYTLGGPPDDRRVHFITALGSYSVIRCTTPVEKGHILTITTAMLNLRLAIGSHVCWELL